MHVSWIAWSPSPLNYVSFDLYAYVLVFVFLLGKICRIKLEVFVCSFFQWIYLNYSSHLNMMFFTKCIMLIRFQFQSPLLGLSVGKISGQCISCFCYKHYTLSTRSIKTEIHLKEKEGYCNLNTPSTHLDQ